MNIRASEMHKYLNQETVATDEMGCAESAAIIAFIPIAMIVNGLTLVQLWQWFIVTTFSAPPLSVPAAIGIAMVIGQFTRGLASGAENKKTTGSRWSWIITNTFLMPLFTLVLGYIVQSFM